MEYIKPQDSQNHMAHSKNKNILLQCFLHQAIALLIGALITDGWRTLAVLLLLFILLNIVLYLIGTKITKLSIALPYILIFIAVMISDIISW